jgi:hypothetical protein
MLQTHCFFVLQSHFLIMIKLTLHIRSQLEILIMLNYFLMLVYCESQIVMKAI